MPNVYVIGGPNGAGKTTIAMRVLPEALGCHEFVNADLIAAGLSPFRVEVLALQAGRLMLERMNKLRDAVLILVLKARWHRVRLCRFYGNVKVTATTCIYCMCGCRTSS
jgi:hypothetical protein